MAANQRGQRIRCIGRNTFPFGPHEVRLMAPDKQRQTDNQPFDKGTSKRGGIDDEMVPEKGEQVKQQKTGGEMRDTAGEHGRMAPESAKALDEEE